MKKYFLNVLCGLKKQDKHFCGPEMEQKCRVWNTGPDLLDSRSRSRQAKAMRRVAAANGTKSTQMRQMARSRSLFEIRPWGSVG